MNNLDNEGYLEDIPSREQVASNQNFYDYAEHISQLWHEAKREGREDTFLEDFNNLSAANDVGEQEGWLGSFSTGSPKWYEIFSPEYANDAAEYFDLLPNSSYAMELLAANNNIVSGSVFEKNPDWLNEGLQNIAGGGAGRGGAGRGIFNLGGQKNPPKIFIRPHNSSVHSNAAAKLPSLSGKSPVDMENMLKNSGFKFKNQTAGGYRKYVHSDGSEVTIRPNGEVIRTSPKVNAGQRGQKTFRYRYDQNGELVKHDSSGKTQNHNTGEFINTLP